jgi:ABC-type nitrate/sulfonate/bicarbonate transport system substrate-binding protein
MSLASVRRLSSPHGRHRIGIPLSALVGITTAVACNRAAESSDNAGGTPTVTIGKAVDTIEFSAIDVAIAKGYFKDARVNVETTPAAGQQPDQCGPASASAS